MVARVAAPQIESHPLLNGHAFTVASRSRKERDRSERFKKATYAVRSVGDVSCTGLGIQ
jgi:hypothetical protein